jgi:hypothetical protein
MHCPPLQRSFVVQKSPSLQEFVLLVCMHVPPHNGVVQLHVSVVQLLLSLQSSWLSQVTVMVIGGPRDLVTSVVFTPSTTTVVCACVLLPTPKHGRSAIELVPPLIAWNLIVVIFSPAVLAQPSSQLMLTPRNPRYRAFPSFAGTPLHGWFRASPVQSLIQPEKPPVPDQLYVSIGQLLQVAVQDGIGFGSGPVEGFNSRKVLFQENSASMLATGKLVDGQKSVHVPAPTAGQVPPAGHEPPGHCPSIVHWPPGLLPPTHTRQFESKVQMLPAAAPPTHTRQLASLVQGLPAAAAFVHLLLES